MHPLAFAGTSRFEIRRRIGAGSMGIVYEAFDRERGMLVALKTMRSRTPESLVLLKQELRSLADVTHPNLVTLHELHVAGDTWFFTMELLTDGVPLMTHVGGDLARLRAALAQLAQAIQAVHDAGQLHRDVKPSNVIVQNGRVVLLDFGVASAFGDRGRAGTPAYAAPEQTRGEACPASDWYAFGVVMYELLTGTLPFVGSSKAILYDKAHYEAPPVRVGWSDAPADLAALCDALLRRDPHERPTGDDVLAALHASQRRRWPRHSDAPLLVGRDGALGTLRAALAEAERGRASLVHVRGASGVGKTTLLQTFLREASTRCVVLASRCYPQESVPYKAVDSLVDALARFVSQLPAAEADAALPRDILLLAHVFPVLAAVDVIARAKRRRGPLPEAHELRRRAFAALRELVTRLAEQHTIVIAIDDAQWGDVDSAPIIEGLVAPPDAPPIVLVLAYRAEDIDAAPLLRALRQPRERLAEVPPPVDIVLEPLDDEDARTVAASILGVAASDPRCAAIANDARGLPFLVHELAHAVRGTGDALRAAVTSRLDGLSTTSRTVLELTALAGQPTGRSVLAFASHLAPAELEAALVQLTTERFLRLCADDTRYECYHDRIREGVVARIDANARRAFHARLARAFSLQPQRDHEALVVHYREAGERTRAGEHALVAADQARAALAFDRAARLYQDALDDADLDDADRRIVSAKLGDALANAGHGAAAASAFLAAARGAARIDAIELQRRAASQYLRFGVIDRGLEVLDETLDAFGMTRPRTSRQAFMSLLVRRAKLWLRGTRMRTREAAQLSPLELVRLDVVWTAATDLAMVDLIVGADFGTRQLLLALSAGEPVRAARGLLTEAMFLGAQGQRLASRSTALIARASALVAGLDDPELPAWVDAAYGIVAYQAGEFREAAERARASVRRLREGCTGVLWEVGGVEVQEAWALFYLGELRALARLVDDALERARTRGNRFDAANFGTGVPALAWAVVDRTARGRGEVEHAIAAWSQRGFHLQHYYALVSLASFDLYENDIAAAWARLAAAWPLLEASRLLVCQSVAIEAHHLRGRIMLAAGDRSGALRALRRLEAYRGNRWADAMRALLQAGIDPRLLADAESICARAELAAFAAAARRRRGELTGDTTLVAEADAMLHERGVARPDAFARMLVPVLTRSP
ncbi:MAG TPA: AAA family ATPase [Kofleriaceae bacterium]|nr:AAA family ATPase [Kofleriaceae bacterium]